MHFIETQDVTIRTKSFEMTGVLSGTKDSFTFESLNVHFIFWFKDGKIDSLNIQREKLLPEQIEIIEACENKIKELLH